MDIISNNLANSISVGFKKDRVSFQDLLSSLDTNSKETFAGEGQNPDPALVKVETDFSQGDGHFTGNMLDFSINGKGFFKIQTPEGVLYTRKGAFKLDAQGVLITQDGHRVMGQNGSITILGDQIQVDNRGRVIADGSEVDQLDVVDIANPKDLVKTDGNMFRSNGSIDELPLPQETIITQAHLEDSNVNVAEEMVNMIHSMRAFESYQKAIQVLDKLDNKATNEVSRVR